METRVATIKLPEAVISYRHRQTADEYRKWLAENPKVPKRKKIRAFDEIADEIYGR